MAMVGVVGACKSRTPILDMVAGTRIDLHVIPIVGAVIGKHRLCQSLRGPFLHVIVAPETYGHTIYCVAAQSGVYTLPLVHLSISSLSRSLIIALLRLPWRLTTGAQRRCREQRHRTSYQGGSKTVVAPGVLRGTLSGG